MWGAVVWRWSWIVFPLRISNSTCGIVRRGIRTRRQTSQLFGLWPRGPQTALYSARFGGLLFMGRFSRLQCSPHVWVEIRAQGRANLLWVPRHADRFSSPENGAEIGSANFARCSAFELHLTFAHQSRPTEIWVKVGSRVAECGNDTAVLQHFLCSKHLGGS